MPKNIYLKFISIFFLSIYLKSALVYSGIEYSGIEIERSKYNKSVLKALKLKHVKGNIFKSIIRDCASTGHLVGVEKFVDEKGGSLRITTIKSQKKPPVFFVINFISEGIKFTSFDPIIFRSPKDYIDALDVEFKNISSAAGASAINKETLESGDGNELSPTTFKKDSSTVTKYPPPSYDEAIKMDSVAPLPLSRLINNT